MKNHKLYKNHWKHEKHEKRQKSRKTAQTLISSKLTKNRPPGPIRAVQGGMQKTTPGAVHYFVKVAKIKNEFAHTVVHTHILHTTYVTTSYFTQNLWKWHPG